MPKLTKQDELLKEKEVEKKARRRTRGPYRKSRAVAVTKRA
jgi:hypothetical protein